MYPVNLGIFLFFIIIGIPAILILIGLATQMERIIDWIFNRKERKDPFNNPEP